MMGPDAKSWSNRQRRRGPGIRPPREPGQTPPIMQNPGGPLPGQQMPYLPIPQKPPFGFQVPGDEQYHTLPYEPGPMLPPSQSQPRRRRNGPAPIGGYQG